MAENTLTATLKLDDQLTRQLTRVGSRVRRVAQRMATGFSRATRAVFNLRNALIATAIAATAKVAASFETSMSQIEGLVGIARSEVDKLQDSVLALGPAVGQGPRQLAEGLFFVTSAGFRGSEALELLEASAKGAAAGLGQTKSVAGALTTAITAFGKDTLSAARAADVLVATVRKGNVEAAQLAPQFGKLLTPAAELGISFDQLGGALAFFTLFSNDAALAGTQLSGILQRLLKPTEQGREALRKASTSAEALRLQIREKGLLATLVDLRKRLEESGQSLGKVFEDARGFVGVLALTGVQAGVAAKIMDDLANSTGTLDDAFRVASQTSGFQFKQLLSALEGLAIAAGSAINTILRAGVFQFLRISFEEATVAVNAYTKGLQASTDEAQSMAEFTIGALRAIAEGMAAVTDVWAGFRIVMKLLELGMRDIIGLVGVLLDNLSLKAQAVFQGFRSVALGAVEAVAAGFLKLFETILSAQAKLPVLPQRVVMAADLAAMALRAMADEAAGGAEEATVKMVELEKRILGLPGALFEVLTATERTRDELINLVTEPTARENVVALFDRTAERMKVLARKTQEARAAMDELGQASITAGKQTNEALQNTAEISELVAGLIQGFASSVADFVGSVLDEAFQGQIRTIQDVGRIAQDVLKSLISAVVRQLVQLAVQSAITRAVAGAAQGAIVIGGVSEMPAFQAGGIITGPGAFIAGEGGQNEAVVPLPDGRSIPVMEVGGRRGGGGGTVKINITAMDSQDVTRVLSSPDAIRTMEASMVRNFRENPDFITAAGGAV